MPLAKHDLVPLGMFQIDKSFLCSFKSRLKAQHVAPEREASPKIVHMKLDDHRAQPVRGGAPLTWLLVLSSIFHLRQWLG